MTIFLFYLFKFLPLFLFKLQFFDGWELDGKYFPNEIDHEKSLSQRSHEFCTNNAEWPFRQLRKRFRSSQNAALLQYRIPVRGSFVATVKFIENPERKFKTNVTVPNSLHWQILISNFLIYYVNCDWFQRVISWLRELRLSTAYQIMEPNEIAH